MHLAFWIVWLVWTEWMEDVGDKDEPAGWWLLVPVAASGWDGTRKARPGAACKWKWSEMTNSHRFAPARQER